MNCAKYFLRNKSTDLTGYLMKKNRLVVYVSVYL